MANPQLVHLIHSVSSCLIASSFRVTAELTGSQQQKMPLAGGLARSRLWKAAVVKLRRLIKPSHHQLSELHHLRQTAQAGGGLCFALRTPFIAFPGDGTNGMDRAIGSRYCILFFRWDTARCTSSLHVV